MYLFDFLDGGLLQLSWWQLIVAALVLTHVTIAAVTIFLHRSQAHRALESGETFGKVLLTVRA